MRTLFVAMILGLFAILTAHSKECRKIVKNGKTIERCCETKHLAGGHSKTECKDRSAPTGSIFVPRQEKACSISGVKYQHKTRICHNDKWHYCQNGAWAIQGSCE